jgi:erythronate-4-phosphate dehydrogenase
LNDLLPAPWLSQVTLNANSDPAWSLAMLCRGVYDPRRDDADFRRSLVGNVSEQRAAFDLLRKHYPLRREIDGLAVRIEGDSPALQKIVVALGALAV